MDSVLPGLKTTKSDAKRIRYSYHKCDVQFNAANIQKTSQRLQEKNPIFLSSLLFTVYMAIKALKKFGRSVLLVGHFDHPFPLDGVAGR